MILRYTILLVVIIGILSCGASYKYDPNYRTLQDDRCPQELRIVRSLFNNEDYLAVVDYVNRIKNSTCATNREIVDYFKRSMNLYIDKSIVEARNELILGNYQTALEQTENKFNINHSELEKFRDSVTILLSLKHFDEFRYNEGMDLLTGLKSVNVDMKEKICEIFENHTNNLFNYDESLFRRLYSNFRNHASECDALEYAILKLDSITEMSYLLKGIEYYNRGSETMANIEFKKIKENGLVYPIFLEYFARLDEYYETKEPERIRLENYYQNLFSKYKSKLSLARKLYSLGFVQTSSTFGSTYDTSNTLIEKYKLYLGDYTVYISVWLNYAYQWLWESWVETE